MKNSSFRIKKNLLKIFVLLSLTKVSKKVSKLIYPQITYEQKAGLNGNVLCNLS